MSRALDPRNPRTQRLLAREAAKPAGDSWWTQPLSREQFDAKAAERARETEATTTQHITRKDGDR